MDILPEEIIYNILKYIPPKNLINLSLINKKFNNICRSDYIWKLYLDKNYPDYCEYYSKYYDVSTINNTGYNLITKSYRELYEDVIKINTPLLLDGNDHIINYLTNNDVPNNVMIINDGYNIHLPERKKLSSIKSTVLFLNNCEKNFVYRCSYGNIFPHVNTIYLNSHPCEPSFFYSFQKNSPKITIYIHENFSLYKYKSWAPSGLDMFTIKSKDYNDILNKYLSRIGKSYNGSHIYYKNPFKFLKKKYI